MTITIGYHVVDTANIHSSLQDCLENGFSFILSSLVHPKCLKFVPFSDVQLTGSDRSNIAVYVPKRNYQFKKNLHLLEKELIYAGHIGINNLIIECPDDFKSIGNMASLINRIVNPDSRNFHNLAIRIKVSMVANKFQSNELRKDCDKTMVDEDYSWIRWNHVRKFLQSHPNLTVALELNGELPGDEKLNRWLGEPLTFIILPTSIFLTNSSNFPVLSRAVQMFLGQVNFKMARSFAFIIKGNNMHGHLKHYVQYLTHLKETDIFVDKLMKFCCDYEDVLQIPLQPLKDNLDSSVYEVFETDIIKYQQYEMAIYRALGELENKDDALNIFVLGAGRGPLVDRSLQAAYNINKYVKILAIEKNPNAIVTLNLLKDLKWGGDHGLPHGSVQIINCDMRNWESPVKADMVISELLGSFGDNELSPECLDGVWKCVTQETICIPNSYTSYLCPVQAHRLYSQVSLSKRTHTNPYEYAYVAHVRNFYMIDQPKPVFQFQHNDLSIPQTARDNSRCEYLMFKSKIKTICHGFVGYFDCCLFHDIRLSIVPSTQNSDMYSWFPIYFPIETPFDVDENETIELMITRNVDELHVWYEWTVLRPIHTKTHNLNGRHYSISLH